MSNNITHIRTEQEKPRTCPKTEPPTFKSPHMIDGKQMLLKNT